MSDGENKNENKNENMTGKKAEYRIKLLGSKTKRLVLGTVLILAALLLPLIGFIFRYVLCTSEYSFTEYVPPEIFYVIPCSVLLSFGAYFLLTGIGFF